MFDWKSLSEISQRTLRLNLAATPFEGLMWAGLQLTPVIARKSLGATDFQIMLLMMVAPVCFLLSVYWAEVIRVLRRWRLLFLAGAAFGIAPLSLMHPFGSMKMLIGLLLCYELANSLNIPLRNRVMQANYPPDRRSGYYGRLAALVSLVMLVVSWPAGRFLDLAPDNWRWIFLIMALAGVIDRSLWFRIPENPEVRRRRPELGSPDWMGQPQALWSQLTRPLVNMRDVLNRNRQFFRWEMQFMLYGLGFFVIITVQPGYLVEGLGLSYSEISIGQVALARLGGVLALPLMGHFHDRHNPASFCARIFVFLALFPLLLYFCSFLPAGLGRLLPFYAAFFLQGVAMSGVMVAWIMSSMAFAGDEDGALYQSIHVTMVGFRGMVGPLLGWSVKTYFGWGSAFALASGLLFLSASLMHRQGRLLGRPSPP